MKLFFERCFFLIRRMMMGDTWAMAKWRWHLEMMNRATILATGKGMGDYKVITEDGPLFPNRGE